MWLGFLAGSLATVYNLPADGTQYALNLAAKQAENVEQAEESTEEPAEEPDSKIPDLSSVQVGEDGWHLVPWLWYGISAAVCFVGVVMIRTSLAASQKGNDEKDLADLDSIKANLENLVAKSVELKGRMGKMAPSKITEFIDKDLAEEFWSFADGRECMVSRFGLTVYADVMTNFAAGERSINRAWSAAADGYIDEAADCVQRAVLLLQDAQSELDQAEKDVA